MNLEAFNLLTFYERQQIIWEKGTFLKRQQMSQWTNQAFRNLERLDFYLADIQLRIC